MWPGPTHIGPVADSSTGNTETSLSRSLSSLVVHVLDRSANSHRETGPLWRSSYETHSVAAQTELETIFTRKVIPIPKSLHPHLKWWLEEDNVLQGQPSHQLNNALQVFTDASKEG